MTDFSKPPEKPALPPPPPPTPRQLARKALALSDDALWEACEYDVFIASGPGGQHRNKTESGVRLTYTPLGITVSATERRSQLMNKGIALERLREKLTALTVVTKPRRPTKVSRAVKQRRLDGKKHDGAKKKARRSKGDW